MDRVVCGDVGFGKTEVALRAAFAAVAGRPPGCRAGTDHAAGAATLSRHFLTGSPTGRYRGGPCCPAFAAAQGTPLALGRLANKSPRVALTSSSARTSLLHVRCPLQDASGSSVIDEEHRFGVKHKESTATLLRADVHVLTMTATPIPRTLNMTLGGLRDLSIIATPPAEPAFGAHLRRGVV